MHTFKTSIKFYGVWLYNCRLNVSLKFEVWQRFVAVLNARDPLKRVESSLPPLMAQVAGDSKIFPGNRVSSNLGFGMAA